MSHDPDTLQDKMRARVMGRAVEVEREQSDTAIAYTIIKDYNPALIREIDALIASATGPGGRDLMLSVLIDAAKEIRARHDA